MKALTLLALLIITILTVQASDLEKEQRWEEQVVGDLFDGEPVTLNDGQYDFPGLIVQADPAKENAVVILHGIGAHPDWPQVVNPLRVQLAEAGWTTLSIQLPILDNEAEPEAYDAIINEASPRIAAALAYLQNQGASGSYIVAHSMGSRMASEFLANSDKQVEGFVGIGMNVGTVEYMDQYELPVLDLYGSDDLEGVLGSAADRASQASGNPRYTQVVVDGANHFFDDMEDELYARVKAWLEAN
jgi:pimeloyl-ACP methyl ester carboxylesterase